MDGYVNVVRTIPELRRFTWRNRIGYPAQPGLIRLSVCLSIRPSVRLYIPAD